MTTWYSMLVRSVSALSAASSHLWCAASCSAPSSGKHATRAPIACLRWRMSSVASAARTACESSSTRAPAAALSGAPSASRVSASSRSCTASTSAISRDDDTAAARPRTSAHASRRALLSGMSSRAASTSASSPFVSRMGGSCFMACSRAATRLASALSLSLPAPAPGRAAPGGGSLPHCFSATLSTTPACERRLLTRNTSCMSCREALPPSARSCARSGAYSSFTARTTSWRS
mmetsp:Transcript_61650/g.195080  ORF Transcript_61650/g.195080 Transcript_61650/m.195080 type:complete len:234 (+) Transcript_61650:108-809(+)